MRYNKIFLALIVFAAIVLSPTIAFATSNFGDNSKLYFVKLSPQQIVLSAPSSNPRSNSIPSSSAPGSAGLPTSPSTPATGTTPQIPSPSIPPNSATTPPNSAAAPPNSAATPSNNIVSQPSAINQPSAQGVRTYKNPDLGLSMQYPSNWIKQTDNLVQNTIAAFGLKDNRFSNTLDFANMTLAEVDIRLYPAPQGETSTGLNIGQLNTQGQALIKQYKNSTTTLGGLPALKIISYLSGGFTQKSLQVWTYVPTKHVLVELIYIVQPSQYSLYLPAVQKMIDSVKITS